MTLETTIDTLALEHAEIVAANEIRHNDIHTDIGFVIMCVSGETASRHLCRKLRTENHN